MLPKRSLMHKFLLKRLKLLYFPPLSHHIIDHIYDFISENVEILMNSININKCIINTSPLFNDIMSCLHFILFQKEQYL